MLRVGSTCVSMHNLAVAGWDGIREGGMGSAKLSSRQSLNRIGSGKLAWLYLNFLHSIIFTLFHYPIINNYLSSSLISSLVHPR